MKIDLKDYQEGAVNQLVSQVRSSLASASATKHAFVLSAPTGSGKTAITTAMLERLLVGDDEHEGYPDATFLWVTDAPELNEQSKKKILATSEVFTPQRVQTIDASFDQPTFDAGKIYFLNTQKLGQGTTYTRTGDQRTYTLWDAISRTAADRPLTFYLVLDEAHKGVGRRPSEVQQQETIVRRLILGRNGIVTPHLLIGISATPARFNDLLEEAADRVRWPTQINPEDVRESGLLKDEIVLWHTTRNGRSEWALLSQAASKLVDYENAWDRFADENQRERVRPILVVQVTDGRGRKATNTDLATALAEIEKVTGGLPAAAVAHCFQEDGPIEVSATREIRKILPSDIQEDEDVRVVFFKMALNTGWDCPRAETMMSFRVAVDPTHIAQLVGRMVRTPLAERILSEEFLNSVALYLPNWDEPAVKKVIEHLTSSEDALPTRIERGENLVTYKPGRGMKPLIEETAGLPTYPSRRANRASNVKRLLQLGRYLANDEIAPTALDDANTLVLETLDRSRNRLRGQIKRLTSAVQRADLIETRATIGRESEEEPSSPPPAITSLALVEQDVLAMFAEAGRRLSGGLHVEYVARRTSGTQRRSATVARAEFCALMNDKATLEDLEKTAGETVKAWWAEHHAARLALTPERQADYARVNRMAAAPEPEDLILLPTITLTRGARAWKRHLYTDAKGDFFPSPALTGWEELTLTHEIGRKGFKGWLRNPVRKEWSLGIPYEQTGVPAVMYPDFLVFRSGGDGIIIDILEPHAPNQGDLAAKLQGLCRYAERHGDRFGRIELLLVQGARGAETLLRINVNDADIREEARIQTENAQVVALAERLARS
jgi:type III restriction enzyme